MATYIGLFNFTAQGVSNIKDSPKRAEKFKALVKKAGGKVRETFWTMGHYDGVVIFDAPGDEAAAQILLTLGAKGNVKNETLRAFDAKEFASIVKRM